MNGRIVTGGRLGRWVVSRDRLRYGRGHGHDTVGCVRDTVGEVCDTALQCARGRSDTAGGAYNTVGPGLRHGQARPATRHSARTVCTQAEPRVGALCTRLSFDSMHCYESLFGKLFMSTVHEVFKKNKNKIK